MSESNAKRVCMDGALMFASITEAGRYLANVSQRLASTCAVEISKATRHGIGVVYGHVFEIVPEIKAVHAGDVKRMTKRHVNELNRQCVELIRATRGLWCEMGDTCIVDGARIGWCRRAYELMMESMYGNGD